MSHVTKVAADKEETRKADIKFILHIGWILAGCVITAIIVHFNVNPIAGIFIGQAPYGALEIVDMIKTL
jgi:hypothetical protein